MSFSIKCETFVWNILLLHRTNLEVEVEVTQVVFGDINLNDFSSKLFFSTTSYTIVRILKLKSYKLNLMIWNKFEICRLQNIKFEINLKDVGRLKNIKLEMFLRQCPHRGRLNWSKYNWLNLVRDEKSRPKAKKLI